jgi:hypothetical protein
VGGVRLSGTPARHYVDAKTGDDTTDIVEVEAASR